MEVFASTAMTKGIVDGIKTFVPELKGWKLLLVVLGVGILSALMFTIRDGRQLTGTEVAKVVIEGVFAALSAVGLTELHNVARKKQRDMVDLEEDRATLREMEDGEPLQTKRRTKVYHLEGE